MDPRVMYRLFKFYRRSGYAFWRAVVRAWESATNSRANVRIKGPRRG